MYSGDTCERGGVCCLSTRSGGSIDPSIVFAAGIDEPLLQDAIYQLDASGFSGSEQPHWKGAGFWKAFLHWRQSKTVDEVKTEPDLYAHA